MPNHVRNILKFKNLNQTQIDFLCKNLLDNQGDFDFNKIIPMPERLNLVSGSITDIAIKCALSKMSYEKRYRILNDIGKNFKYYENINYELILNEEKNFLENEVNSEYYKEIYKKFGIKTLEDLGYAYINNKVDYGHFNWYDWCIENWGTKWNAYDNYVIKGKTFVKFIFNTAWVMPKPIYDKLQELSVLNCKFNFEVKYADEDIGNNCGKFEYKDFVFKDLTDTIKNKSSFAKSVWRY